jgi:UDP-N-acetylglucosamine 4,6-dehydratase
MTRQLKKELLNLNRLAKQIIAASADFILITFSLLLSLYVSGISPREFPVFMWIPFLSINIFYLIGVYRTVLRYINFSLIYLLLRAALLTFILIFAIQLIFIYILSSYTEILKTASDYLLTEEGLLVGLLFSIVSVVGIRLAANFYFLDQPSEKKVIIYGAGAAGIQLAGALRVSSEMETVAFVDVNPLLNKTYIGGIKVLNPKKLQKLILKNKVDEVLIAMPSASKSSLRALLREIENYSVKVRILPGLAELALGKILISELKEVEVSDLLGRLEVEANQELLDSNICEKVVLITGSGGSIGSEIARQVAKLRPKKIILLDSNEYALYAIKKELESLAPEVNLYAVLGNVKDYKRMLEVCKSFGVNTIYHTAAYKHVPLVEENPFEGASNNILGTKSCAQAAIDSKVETFVLISTDKAVRPTNIMGATKRFSEMILQSLSAEDDDKNITRMCMVRFGNVIGSSGSAIPLFQQQIKNGGPVTVTHPEVIRYFMSIPEAAELVIQAGAMGKGGDVFVLDMGEPVKIYELAKRLINLSGMELKDKTNPDGEIEIIFTGLRPGEKLYEELLIGDNVSTTEHKQILRAEEDFLSKHELDRYIALLKEAEKDDDVVALKAILKEVISGFTPEDEIVDVVYLQKQQ